MLKRIMISTRTSIKLISIGLIFLSLAISPKNAFAAQTTDLDEDKPVEIQSHNAIFDDKKGTATYLGKVTMRQGSRHLTSDSLIILRNTHGQIESMIATGKPAHFHAKPNLKKPFASGQAKTIQYFPNQDKMLLLEDAVLIQNEGATGGATIRGDKLVYSPSTQTLISKPTSGKKTTIILPPKT